MIIASSGPPHTTPASGRRRLIWSLVGYLTVSTLVWTYAVFSLFIVDIPSLILSSYAPPLEWLLEYRLLFFASLFAIALIFSKKSRFFGWIAAVLLFPFVLLLLVALIPVALKSWNLGVALLNSAISTFTTIKFKAITTALYLIACIIILRSEADILLLASATAILLLVIITYIRRFISVFSPSSALNLYRTISSRSRESLLERMSSEDRARAAFPSALLTVEERRKWAGGLEQYVLFNRLCLFAAMKLKDYHRSGMILVSSCISTLGLLLFTIASFSLLNYALFKALPSQFLSAEDISFFTFIYYSFNAFVFNTIGELQAIAPISQILGMLEGFLALLVGVIFASLLLSVKTRRYADELERVVVHVREEGEAIGTAIKTEYRLPTVEDAITELEKIQAGMTKLLLLLTAQLR